MPAPSPFRVLAALMCLVLSWHGLQSTYAAPWAPENAAWNINFNPDGSDPSKYFGKWRGHRYTPSPADWRSVAIYHVMLDRFSDGDPRNNDGKYGGYDPGKVNARQGGDFVGLTNKLDYIKSLGFDAILISPIFQNLENEYHGYGQIDFTLLDDRLGTLEEFRALVNAAHQRGMYVIVDVVVNHLSYLLYNEGHEDSTAPFRFHTGEYRLVPRNEGQTYADFRFDNRFDPDGTYCSVYNYDGKRHDDSGKGTFSWSDFHHNGDLTNYYDPWNIHLGQLYSSYNDLRLCSARVQNKIIAMTQALITSTDIDGLRIDTPMQVPLEFFKNWTPAVKQHAASLGKSNFFMFGEVYAPIHRTATMIGRGRTPAQYGKDEFISPTSAMDSGIDYFFYINLIRRLYSRDTFDVSSVARSLSAAELHRYDQWRPENKRDEFRMLNFFNSHDQRRVITTGIGFEGSRALAILIAFWPGIPLYYYGDEQALSSYGTALDGHARESMMTSLAWRDHPAVEHPNKASADNFDMASATYVETGRIFSARKAMSEILLSNNSYIYSSDETGSPSALVFARKNDSRFVWVVINYSSNPISIKFPTRPVRLLSADTVVVDVLSDRRFEVSAQGDITMQLGRWEAFVLVPEEARPPSPLRIIDMVPKHDSAVVSGETTRINVKFDSAVRTAEFCKNLGINGKNINCKHISRSADGRSFTFPLEAREGMNILSVAANLSDESGRSLAGSFRARLRAGAAVNPLVSSDRPRAQLLVNGDAYVTHDPKVVLEHRAEGAQYFRTLNVGEKFWSPWQPFQRQSPWILSQGGGWKEVAVQYWADGSGAYYAQDGIDLITPDGLHPSDE